MKIGTLLLAMLGLAFLTSCGESSEDSYQSGYSHGYSAGYEDGIQEGAEALCDELPRNIQQSYC